MPCQENYLLQKAQINETEKKALIVAAITDSEASISGISLPTFKKLMCPESYIMSFAGSSKY